MHDNILAATAPLKVVMSVKSFIGSSSRWLVCYNTFHFVALRIGTIRYDCVK